MNRHTTQPKRANNTMAYILLIVAGVYLFSLAFTRAINTSIKNQDTMLCNSAKVSGNREYTNKCQCFYKSGDIECLQTNK